MRMNGDQQAVNDHHRLRAQARVIDELRREHAQKLAELEARIEALEVEREARESV